MFWMSKVAVANRHNLMGNSWVGMGTDACLHHRITPVGGRGIRNPIIWNSQLSHGLIPLVSINAHIPELTPTVNLPRIL